MKQAYGYIVKNGCQQDWLNMSCSFIIFTDDVNDADKYIEDYIKEEIEKEKHKDDDGNIINYWWRYYLVDKVSIKSFDNNTANIVWLGEENE